MLEAGGFSPKEQYYYIVYTYIQTYTYILYIQALYIFKMITLRNQKISFKLHASKQKRATFYWV